MAVAAFSFGRNLGKCLEVWKIVCIFAAKYIDMSSNVMIKTISDYFKTQPVLKAWLFGSYARGEENADSDIDILVTFDNNAKVSLLKHAIMADDLEKILGRPVDLVTDGTLLPFAVNSVSRDKQLIYERTC